jgi:hypothetical protein
MNDLARYSYCFKFFEAGSPFKVMPVSVALTPIDHEGPDFHVILKEGAQLALAHPEWFPPEDLEALFASTAIVLDRQDAANKLLHYIAPATEVQLWSMHDTHCRHFFAELYGGMDQGGFLQFLGNNRTEKILPRDMNHIYYGLNKQPKLLAKPEGHEWDALKVAHWQADVFEGLRRRAQMVDVNVVPTNQTPAGHQRIFHDWEYYRESPFVLWPISLGAITQDGSKTLHVAIDEGLVAFENSPNKGKFHHEWIKANVLPKLEGVERVSAEEATQRFLDMLEPSIVTEIWSDDDNHDRHLTGSLGIGGQSFYRLAREQGRAQQILFRDTKHLRLYLGDPKMVTKENGQSHNALEDARNVHENLRFANNYAAYHGITKPETILPVDFMRGQPSPESVPEFSLLHAGK